MPFGLLLPVPSQEFVFEAAFIRCYSCDSKENECSEYEYGSKIDCSASKGCRIAKKNDLEDPQWDRGCAVEADFFCDTFDNPNGEEGVSWGRKYFQQSLADRRAQFAPAAVNCATKTGSQLARQPLMQVRS